MQQLPLLFGLLLGLPLGLTRSVDCQENASLAERPGLGERFNELEVPASGDEPTSPLRVHIEPGPSRHLFVTATSLELVPVLRLARNTEVVSLPVVTEGNGACAFLELELAEGEGGELVVDAEPEARAAVVRVRVCWIEDGLAEGASALEEAREALDEASALRLEGDLRRGRERLATCIERVLELSHERWTWNSIRFLDEACETAYGLQATDLLLKAHAPVLEFYEWCHPRLHADVFEELHKHSLAWQRVANWAEARRIQEDLFRRLETEAAMPARFRHRLALDLAKSAAELGDRDLAEMLVVDTVHALQQEEVDEGDSLMAHARAALAAVESWSGDSDDRIARYEVLSKVLEAGLPGTWEAWTHARRNLGEALNLAGRSREAVPVLEDALVELERELPPTDRRIQSARRSLGNALFGIGEVAAALSHLEAAHAVLEATVDADDQELQSTKSDLASKLHATGEFHRARKLREELYEPRSRTLADDHPHLRIAREALAETLEHCGELERALELRELVLKSCQASPKCTLSSLQSARNELALLLVKLGRYEEAEGLLDHMERDLILAGQGRGSAWRNVQTTRADLALARGADHEAVELLRRVHEHDKLVLEPTDPVRLLTTHNYAMVLARIGPAAESIGMLEHTIRELEKSGNASKMRLFGLRANLAGAYIAAGNHARGVALGLSLLDEHEDDLPTGHPILMQLRTNLAAGLLRLGDPQVAMELILDSLEAIADRDLSLPEERRATLVRLSQVYMALGEAAMARTIFDELYEHDLRSGGASAGALRQDRMNLAAAMGAAGDHAAAIDLNGLLLEELGTADPPDPESSRLVRLNLSGDLSALGRHEEALALREAVLAEELAGARGTRDARTVVAVLESLVATGSWERALDLAGELVLGLEEGLLDIALSGSPRQAEEYVLSAQPRLSLLLDLAALCPRTNAAAELETQVLELVERMRMASAAMALAMRRELDPAARGAGELVGSGHSVTGAARGAGGGLVDAVRRRDQVFTTSRMALKSREELEADLRAFTLAAVRAELGAHEAFVRFLAYSRAGAEHLLAFVGLADGSSKRVELGRHEDLERLAAAWREAIGAPWLDPDVEPSGAEDASAQALGVRLRERLVDPVLEAAGEVLVLHVVPDGVVHHIPLEALPLSGAAVGDWIRLRYRPQLGDPLSGTPEAPGDGALVVGALNYGRSWANADSTRTAGGAAAGWSFEALPGAPDEVSAVRRCFERVGVTSIVELTADQATAERLAEIGSEIGLLHFATHGLHEPGELEIGVGRMADVGLIQFEHGFSRRALVGSVSPLSLSWLALSGANAPCAPDGTHPGRVSAEEICAWDLRKCRLVVLTACHSATGVARSGRSIASLQRAFHIAGARQVVANRWQVEDEDARSFATRFYELLGSGIPVEEAFEDARLQLRDRRRPLRAWAGWILTGR